jgi:hypothetical protein
MKRVALMRVALIAELAFAARGVHAEDAGVTPLAVLATCERAAGPGRVRCDVEVRATAPRTLRWVDVQVVETPPFVAPLKGRVGPSDASVREPELVRFALGMIARERGVGEIRLRVRAVVCEGARCAPDEHEARARVAVGAGID